MEGSRKLNIDNEKNVNSPNIWMI